jgi:hypothetical protein
MSHPHHEPADEQGTPGNVEEAKLIDEVLAAQDAFRDQVVGRPDEGDDGDTKRKTSWLTPVI